MTYCFGYHYGNSVFLFADTIVTATSIPNSGTKTSFGETLAPVPGESFSETATKIVRVDASCLVAIAGDADRALVAVDLLRDALQCTEDFPGAMKMIICSLDRTHKNVFELLISHCAGGKPTLWYWDSAQGEALECEADGLWAIGQQVDVIDMHLTETAKVVRSLTMNDDTMLALMTGTFQSAVIQALTVSQGLGVGGVVLSARLDSTGVHWMSDTNYIVYGDPNEAVDLIQIRHREGGFAVSSPNYEHIRLCLQKCDTFKWQQQWEKPVMESIFFKKSHNWMFISYLGFGGVLVQEQEAFDECNLFDARFSTQGPTGFAILKVFQLLLREVVRRPDAPQFVFANKANCRQVLASSLKGLLDVDITGSPDFFRDAVRIEARTFKYVRKPRESTGTSMAMT